MTRSITMNTKMLLWGFAEGEIAGVHPCLGPEAGFPRAMEWNYLWDHPHPKAGLSLPLKAACGFNLITPPLTKLSILSGSNPILSSSARLKAHFPHKVHLPHQPTRTYSHLISYGTHTEHCTPECWNMLSSTVLQYRSCFSR